MPLSNKHSWGLTALAATSSLGAWLIWKSMSPAPTYHYPSKGRRGGKKSGGPFDFVNESSTATKDRAMTDASERSTTSTVTTASCSTLGEDELEQVWTPDGKEANLKILRQLVEQKEARRRKGNKSHRVHSRLSLFSHLVTRLEETIEERNRITDKLGHMRVLKDCDNNSTSAATTATTDSLRGDPALASPTKKAGAPPAQQQPGQQFGSNSSVCMVVQRYRGATLLCNENEIVRVGANTSVDQTSSLLEPGSEQQSSCGLLVYVSFAKGCTRQAVQAASKIVVNLPLLTLGGWGDGSKTMNVIDMGKQHPDAASITIVPQANLINKIKSQGKSIQYHAQIDKAEGNTLYQYFVNSVRGLVLEQQCQHRNEPLPGWYSRARSAQAGFAPERASPSIPPEDIFHNTSLYKSWDDNGIPLTDAEDESLTKSAQKKLRKAQAAHRVKHMKYLRENKSKGADTENHIMVVQSVSPSDQQPQKHIEHWATAIDPSFVQVVAGTFGKRQGLEFVGSMGPLCHVVQV